MRVGEDKINIYFIHERHVQRITIHRPLKEIIKIFGVLSPRLEMVITNSHLRDCNEVCIPSCSHSMTNSTVSAKAAELILHVLPSTPVDQRI